MNILRGTIVGIQSSSTVSLVCIDVDGDQFTAMILEGHKGPENYPQGAKVDLIFKETEVAIAKGLSGLISVRNRFPGRIQQIETGQVLTKIRLDYRAKAVSAIISTPAAVGMNLKQDDKIEWLVKASEIALMWVVP